MEWLPTDAHLNIIDDQIDIRIRIGIVPDNRFIVKILRPVGVNRVAAPDLIVRHGLPGTLQNSNTGRLWPWPFADGSSFFPVQPASASDSCPNSSDV